MCCCEKICAIDLLLCFANARVSYVSFDGRGEIEIGKLQKPPWKLKNAHMRLPPMRESFPRTTLKKHFGLTLLTSSSSHTNRQPQTLTNNPPPGAGIGTNGGAQVDDAARKQDALSYLRHLKDRLKDRKQTYDEFLEIMKEFKAQRWVFFLQQSLGCFLVLVLGDERRIFSKRFWTRSPRRRRGCKPRQSLLAFYSLLDSCVRLCWRVVMTLFPFVFFNIRTEQDWYGRGDQTREENFQRPSGFDFRLQSVFTSRARNSRGRYRERRTGRGKATSARAKAASGVCPRDFVREQNQNSFRERRESVQDVFGDFEHV